MKNSQIVGLIIALAVIIGAIAYLENGKVAPSSYSGAAPDVALPETVATSTAPSALPASSTAERIAEKSARYERAKEIVDPTGFVNTGGQPITLSQYIGKKVILLDIMTYSCINCIRTFPYLVSWYKKYEDKGLVIIGIHTPEFDFEKNIDNVKAAMEKYGITFPVVLDNNYGTWTAYHNLYWPRKYLIDIDGFIRYDHIGEGGYDETESMIQSLLAERAQVLGLGTSTLAAIDMPTTAGATEQNVSGMSQETYFGSARNEFFGNPTATVPAGQNGQDAFAVPNQSSQLASGEFYLGGTWSIQSDHAENVSLPAQIVYPFTATHVYLVASADAPVPVQVTIDGVETKTVTVQEPRLYDIYDGASYGSHILELSPQAAGLKAFTLTFGS
ncbi:MAG: redoxin domain-containing protein [Patescibacteria group bacterium]|nr:redoxin domain-containing protein [Patescibacteria group bacterium]